MRYGAGGIVPSCGKNKICSHLRTFNGGSVDEFIFEHSGYKPGDDIGKLWFWSSSANSDGSGGFAINGNNGYYTLYNKYGPFAVRCVSTQ